MTPEIAQRMESDYDRRTANMTRHWDIPAFDRPLQTEYQVPRGDVKLVTKISCT